jgi:hypothetical protein
MADADEVAVLRIELEGVEPLIWRRVAVRTTMTLADLHRVVQAAMGWLDCHLWTCETDGRKYGMHLPDDPEWNETVEDAKAITLRRVLESGARKLDYVYDMGDFWEHSIIVEKVSAPLSDVRYPEFLGGERRCPPEDCGGPYGYHEFLKKISSKQRRARGEALRWYGGPYDPDDIGERKIVDALGEIGRATNAA